MSVALDGQGGSREDCRQMWPGVAAGRAVGARGSVGGTEALPKTQRRVGRQVSTLNARRRRPGRAGAQRDPLRVWPMLAAMGGELARLRTDSHGRPRGASCRTRPAPSAALPRLMRAL